MSAAAAAASTTAPTRVRVMPSSSRMMPRVGMAVTDSASPRNRVSPASGTGPAVGCGSRCGWMTGPSPAPAANGSTTPAAATATAAHPFTFRCSAWNSSPMRKSSRITPSSASTWRILGKAAADTSADTPGRAGSNTAAHTPGSTALNSDGPSSSPATISPATAGW